MVGMSVVWLPDKIFENILRNEKRNCAQNLPLQNVSNKQIIIISSE